MKIKAHKGCVNANCEMCKKKKHADKKDSYCAKCGMELSFVCKKCHTVLLDSSAKYCISCQAEIDDKKENGKGIAGKAAAVAGVIGAATPVIKKGVNLFIKK